MSSLVYFEPAEMRTWGQALVACMALAIFGLATDDNPDREAIPGIIIFGAVGTY